MHILTNKSHNAIIAYMKASKTGGNGNAKKKQIMNEIADEVLKENAKTLRKIKKELALIEETKQKNADFLKEDMGGITVQDFENSHLRVEDLKSKGQLEVYNFIINAYERRMKAEGKLEDNYNKEEAVKGKGESAAKPGIRASSRKQFRI